MGIFSKSRARAWSREGGVHRWDLWVGTDALPEGDRGPTL
jgi:hypothetical protein